MTMQTVALAGLAVLLVLFLVARRRRAAAAAAPPGREEQDARGRAAPRRAVGRPEAVGPPRATRMGPPAPEPMDWPPFRPEEDEEEAERMVVQAEAREEGQERGADPAHEGHGDEAPGGSGPSAGVAGAPAPLAAPAPYAVDYPEGVVITEPGWPMPGELDMGDWQPAASSALGAASATTRTSVEAAPAPDPAPAAPGETIGSFEPQGDAIIGGFDPVAGWGDDDAGASATLEIGAAEAGPSGAEAEREPEAEGWGEWEPLGAWQPEEEAGRQGLIAEPADAGEDDAVPEAAANVPESEVRWPVDEGDEVEIEVVPPLGEAPEAEAAESSFAWPEPAPAPRDEDVAVDAQEEPEADWEPETAWEPEPEGPAPEHFAPMDGPPMWAPPDGDAREAHAEGGEADAEGGEADEEGVPEQGTGRFALGGFALRPGQEALASVRFREPMDAAPDPADIELVSDGALNCRGDDVVVLREAGVAPTAEGFTVRVAALAPGPFAASGTFRVHT